MRLQFVTVDNFGSHAIAYFGGLRFSHVDYVMADGSLLGSRSDKIGKVAKGVQIRPPNYLNFSRRVIFTIPATPDQEAAVWQFLAGQIGKPYDWRAIWGFITYRDWHERDSWICSELIAAALEYAKVCQALFLDTWDIAPGALALTVSSWKGVEWQDIPIVKP
jgi:hypothetical protein